MRRLVLLIGILLVLGLAGTRGKVCAAMQGCGDCANHSNYSQWSSGYINQSACPGPQDQGGPAPCWWMYEVDYSGWSAYSYMNNFVVVTDWYDAYGNLTNTTCQPAC